MSAPKTILPPEVVLEAYQRHQGNKSEAAKELGLHRQTLRNLINLYGFDKRPLLGGTSKPIKNNVMPLPAKGKVKRYILSSAQNNTRVFAPFLRNLEAYAEWLRAEGRSESVQLMLARFTYNKNAFSNPSKSKPGKQAPTDADVWFDPSIEPYVCDDPEKHGTCRWRLAPDLWFSGEMQIDPTASKPLSGLGTYTGSDSCIFPHVRVAMEAVPTLLCNKTPYVKHVYTTGTVTGRNYIQRKAGLKAEFHHQFCALLVEVTEDGWWVRQLNADKNGSFNDVPNGSVIHIKDGGVVTEGNRIEAINWGDVHVTDLPKTRENDYWARTDGKAVIDRLRPKYQFFHDLFSFRTRSHHDMKSFGKMFEKHINGKELVDSEVQLTAAFLSTSERDFCSSIVVNSNHDRHLEKYLDEVNYKNDIINAEFFLRAQLDRVLTIKRGEKWIALEWAMRQAGAPETIRFLSTDESVTICARSGHPIECGLHGDIGPNGSRGTTSNLSTLGCKVNKGHSHAAAILDGVYSAGTCSEDQGYNKIGATSWSVSHIVTYTSGKRSIITERNGMLWA